jgi:para-nitrobenzyl esterase
MRRSRLPGVACIASFGVPRVAVSARRLGWAAIELLVAIGAVCAPLPAQTDESRAVTTEGVVQGSVQNGVARFLGIPYAAAPIGALRWKPPQPHASWTGVRSATAFGPTCAQITTLGPFAGPANDHEDCLYLNVYAPAVRATPELPVIVWIHGGGDMCGESNDYDGSKLAAQGQTIVVTFNYRLGLFGWVAQSALDAEGHLVGNYGLLDQQMVLQWVQRNIGAFGGDSSRVTLGGQSAGSQDTEANVVSPLAAGRFQRAIFQSIVEEPISLADAETAGNAFAVAAGCGTGATPAVAQCLRNLSARQIIALSGTASRPSPYITGPIADGRVIPRDGFAAAIKSGHFNHVPIISGTTSDEANFKLAVTEYYSGPPRVPASEKDYRAYVTTTFGGAASVYPAGTVDKIFARYPLHAYPSAQLAIDAARTSFLACTQRRLNRLLATRVPVYAYEFRDTTAPFFFPHLPDFQPLAYHTSDIPYFFPNWHGGPAGISHPLSRAQAELSDQLVALWAGFARTGDPNGQGNALWPRYDAGAGVTAYYLAENIPALSTFTDAQFSDAHHCDVWETILVS